MRELITQYAATLLAQFQYDVKVLSTHMWMYWCLCIPAVVYVAFMFIKWAVLTMPMWVTALLVSRGIRGWPIHFNIEPRKEIKYYAHKN